MENQPTGSPQESETLTEERPRVGSLVLMILVLVMGLVGLGILGGVLNKGQEQKLPGISQDKKPVEMAKFASEDEFRTFVEAGGGDGGGLMGMGVGMAEMRTTTSDLTAPMAQESVTGNLAFDSRVSETNVQVEGIDEPDIVKTNGEEIYYSRFGLARIMPSPLRPTMDVGETSSSEAPERMIWPAPDQGGRVAVIDALPANEVNELGEIDAWGEMLLVGQNLVVFENEGIRAFDTSDPANPEETWKLEYEETGMVTARLYENQLYVVTRKYVGGGCPGPIWHGANELTIACNDIYRPNVPVTVDSTFTLVKLDPTTGQVLGNVSFVGSSSQSVVYMSGESMYVSYSFSGDLVAYMVDFYRQVGSDLVSVEALEKLERLAAMDISNQAKMVEMSQIIQTDQARMDQSERRRVENEMSNRLSEFANQRGRELWRTAIVKIGTKEVKMGPVGEVAGEPLNQFSLDEYEGFLRVATTTGSSFGAGKSRNDVYILDENLNVTGEILDLGLDERIYSVRFMGDTGYLVTFKQIDPFYVLDLADVKNPKVAGELKIPGFSSYLHPLTEELVLGVGQEDGRVKLSVFDVSNKNNPVEREKYLMDEYWSQVQSNHRAFLGDSQNQVFFLPAGSSGYIFSYSDGLKLLKVVPEISAERAVFIGDNWYILGQEKLVVLNNSNWEETANLSLN